MRAVAIVIASTAIAHADPNTYVELGAFAGGESGAAVGAFSVDGGYRLHDDLWLHARAADGSATVVMQPSTGNQSYYAARIGVEARACGDIACVVAGADAAVRHIEFHTEYDATNTTGVLAVPRCAVELGGAHLRFHAGFEGSIRLRGLVGVDFDGGVAYRW